MLFSSLRNRSIIWIFCDKCRPLVRAASIGFTVVIDCCVSKWTRLSDLPRLRDPFQNFDHILPHLFVLYEFFGPILQALKQPWILHIGSLMRMIVAQSSLRDRGGVLDTWIVACFAWWTLHKARILLGCTSIRGKLFHTLRGWYKFLSWLIGLLLNIHSFFNFQA